MAGEAAAAAALRREERNERGDARGDEVVRLAKVALATGLASLAASATSAAETVEASATVESGALTLVLENDVLARDDAGYTSGAALIWVPRTTPAWAARVAHGLPWIPGESGVRLGLAIGQSIFTPSDISLDEPPADDRPYAGWLYATLGLGIETGRTLDQLALTLGVVGPASGAEQTQKLLHELVPSQKPRGWDTQLENEPGIVLTYQRSWRQLARVAFAGLELDGTPHLGATLGNVHTHANAGLTLRLGQRLPLDFGPARAQPSLPVSGFFAPTERFAWYLLAGVDGRAVAYDVFLDGNTFRDSRSVDKEPLVGDLQLGLVLTFRRVRLSATYVFRSREFETERETDQFGGVALSVAY